MQSKSEHPRVIIALLPDENAVDVCHSLNDQLLGVRADREAFAIDFRDGSQTSQPHMTVAQLNCIDVEGLMQALTVAVDRWQQPAGLRSHRIAVHFRDVGRFRKTPFVFWNADLAAASLNWPLVNFARLLLEGWGMVPPTKRFAVQEEAGDWLTASERHLLETVGYSHAGLWHITVGLLDVERDASALFAPREEVVHFDRLVLGLTGPCGTIAEVVKTWELE